MPDLRALLAAATPGPWRLRDRGPAHDFDRVHIVDAGIGYKVSKASYEDASLIVAAVNALPALLDVVEAARTVMVEYDKTHLTHDVDYENVADAIDAMRLPLRALDRLEATDA